MQTIQVFIKSISQFYLKSQQILFFRATFFSLNYLFLSLTVGFRQLILISFHSNKCYCFYIKAPSYVFSFFESTLSKQIMIKDIRRRQTTKIYGVTILRLGWPITYLNGVLSLTGGKFSIMYQILQSLDLPSGLYFR